MLGTQDLVVGLVIALFFFGAKRLPEMARSLGKSMQEFKKGIAGDTSEHEAPPTPAPTMTETVAVPRSCASCQTLLEPEWSHCPRCGAPAPPKSAADPHPAP